jgi:hypothetical protein
MWMRPAPDGSTAVKLGGATTVGLAIAAIGTIAIGLVPPVTVAVIAMAEQAARALL